MKLILYIIDILYSIITKPWVYREPLITLITLFLTLASLVVTIEPSLVNSAQPSEAKKSESSTRILVTKTFIAIFIVFGSGFTILFEIKKINEKFAEIKTDDKEQSKKILGYISTVNVGKIDIFDQYLEGKIWNKEILEKLNEKGAKIYVKNRKDVLERNEDLNEIVNNENSKIEIKEWGSAALNRILNIDSLHSRFILVNYEGPDDDSFYSYKRTTENGQPVYQNFNYSDNKHPIVEMSKDFYHIVEKIRDFSDQLNRPIGYYFVIVSPMNETLEEQKTEEFSLVQIQPQGEYRIRYRGASLSKEKDTISSQWNSTIASFNENIPDSRSRLLFFTGSSHIQTDNSPNIENWGIIEFNNSGRNGENKWSGGLGYFFDIETNAARIKKKAKIELYRIEIVETETEKVNRGEGEHPKFIKKEIEIFENYFTNPSTYNNENLAKIIKEASEFYLRHKNISSSAENDLKSPP